jgi:hypothetical protein
VRFLLMRSMCIDAGVGPGGFTNHGVDDEGHLNGALPWRQRGGDAPPVTVVGCATKTHQQAVARSIGVDLLEARPMMMASWCRADKGQLAKSTKLLR